MDGSRNKFCRTWYLFERLRRRDSAAHARFGLDAQAALDAGHEDAASREDGHSLYRAGVTLADLRPGECGTVQMLIGSSHGRLRLLEMGLTQGTHVKVIRTAAFGGPFDIMLRGYQLSLRREEAAAVWLDDGNIDR
jgi:Fe2+ transport system protein FeoA